LTQVPRQGSAQPVAALSRQRGTLDTACPHLEASCPAAINPFGSPQAAGGGWCLALVASHGRAVVLAAWRRGQGAAMVDEEGALSEIVNAITTTDHGLMLAIPEPEWDVWYAMRTAA